MNQNARGIRQLKSGRYQARYFAGFDSTGKRVYPSKTFMVLADALSWRDVALRQKDKGVNLSRGGERDLSPKVIAKMGGTGAMSELLVCIELARRGYDVYRSMAVTGACDLIALDQTGRCCRVEVKTAHWSPTKRAQYRLSAGQETKHDVLAVVILRESFVEFQPTIEEWFCSCPSARPSLPD